MWVERENKQREVLCVYFYIMATHSLALPSSPNVTPRRHVYPEFPCHLRWPMTPDRSRRESLARILLVRRYADRQTASSQNPPLHIPPSLHALSLASREVHEIFLHTWPIIFA